MILLVHMLFGAAIGSIFKNPILAIFLAFLGHYALDILPHIEYLASTEKSITNIKHHGFKKSTHDSIKVILDVVLGILLIWVFSKNQPIIYLCGIIAIIPDGLTVLTHLFPRPLLVKHHQFHGGTIHYLTKQKNFPVLWKISSQVIAGIISIVILVWY